MPPKNKPIRDKDGNEFTTDPKGEVPLTTDKHWRSSGNRRTPNINNPFDWREEEVISGQGQGSGSRGGRINKENHKRTGGKLRKHRKTKKGSRRHKSRKHHKKSSRRYHR